jgi:hypothetical protein
MIGKISNLYSKHYHKPNHKPKPYPKPKSKKVLWIEGAIVLWYELIKFALGKAYFFYIL